MIKKDRGTRKLIHNQTTKLIKIKTFKEQKKYHFLPRSRCWKLNRNNFLFTLHFSPAKTTNFSLKKKKTNKPYLCKLSLSLQRVCFFFCFFSLCVSEICVLCGMKRVIKTVESLGLCFFFLNFFHLQNPMRK